MRSFLSLLAILYVLSVAVALNWTPIDNKCTSTASQGTIDDVQVGVGVYWNKEAAKCAKVEVTKNEDGTFKVVYTHYAPNDSSFSNPIVLTVAAVANPSNRGQIEGFLQDQTSPFRTNLITRLKQSVAFVLSTCAFEAGASTKNVTIYEFVGNTDKAAVETIKTDAENDFGVTLTRIEQNNCP